MSRFGALVINGERYDLDELTLGEAEEIEELAGGIPFAELSFGSAKVLRAYAYVLMRRRHPEISLEEVGRVRLLELLPPDEEMPQFPPPHPEPDLGASEPGASGVQPSAAPTPG